MYFEAPKKIVLHWQIHQPLPLRESNFFTWGKSAKIFEEAQAEQHLKTWWKNDGQWFFQQIKLLKESGAFHIALNVSGITLEQWQQWCPEAISALKLAVEAQAVTLTTGPYYFGLTYLLSAEELRAQVIKHQQLIKSLFHVSANTYCGPAQLFQEEMLPTLRELGIQQILTAGLSYPNNQFHECGLENLHLLASNAGISHQVNYQSSTLLEKTGTAGFIDFMAQEEGEGIHLFLDGQAFNDTQKSRSIFHLIEAVNTDERFVWDDLFSVKTIQSSFTDSLPNIWGDMHILPKLLQPNNMQHACMDLVYMKAPSSQQQLYLQAIDRFLALAETEPKRHRYFANLNNLMSEHLLNEDHHSASTYNEA